MAQGHGQSASEEVIARGSEVAQKCVTCNIIQHHMVSGRYSGRVDLFLSPILRVHAMALPQKSYVSPLCRLPLGAYSVHSTRTLNSTSYLLVLRFHNHLALVNSFSTLVSFDGPPVAVCHYTRLNTINQSQ